MKPAVSAGCDNKEKVMRRANRKKGFTLVETILSSVIMCGAVLALGSIGTRCLSETRLNRHYEKASSLANKQLHMIDFMGVEEFIEAGVMSGTFEEIDLMYGWTVQTQSQEIDNLYLVRVTVSWSERRHVQSVTVDTMFNGKGTLAETDEAGEAGAGGEGRGAGE